MKKKLISIRAIERILRLEGAKRVSKEVVVLVSEKTEEYAKGIARRAVKNALLDGRKTVKKEDVE